MKLILDIKVELTNTENHEVCNDKAFITYEYDATYYDCREFATEQGYESVDDLLNKNDVDKEEFDYIVGKLAQGKVYPLESAICIECGLKKEFQSFLSQKYATLILTKACDKLRVIELD